MTTPWDLHTQRERANRHPCPHCAAPTAVTCHNPRTGEELQHLPAHDARLKLTDPTTDQHTEENSP